MRRRAHQEHKSNKICVFWVAENAHRMTLDQNQLPFRSKTGQYCYVAYWNEPTTLAIETAMNISYGISRLDRSFRPGVSELQVRSSSETPGREHVRESFKRIVSRTVRSTDT